MERGAGELSRVGEDTGVGSWLDAVVSMDCSARQVEKIDEMVWVGV